MSNAITIPMTGERAARHDTPWRRLPWTGPLAILVWLLALWWLSLFMTRTPARPERSLPVAVRFIELPEPPALPSPAMRPVTPQALRTQRQAVPVAAPTPAAVAPSLTQIMSDEVPQTSMMPAQPALPGTAAAMLTSAPISAGRPDVAIRTEAAGVIERPQSLSVFNEEATIDGDGWGGVRRGEWMQSFSDDRDPSTEASGSLVSFDTLNFTQPPRPWCHDANAYSPWEIGTCRDDLDRATAAYKRNDYTTAFARFKTLATKEYAPAQFSLGVMYAEGLGTRQDDEQAVYWWRRAAKDGDAKAAYNLALAYSDGKGVPKDDRQAVAWYRKAAYFGVADAQYNLGVMYASGTGVAKDGKQAAYWYRKAAERGNPIAQYNLGVMYADGTDIPKDGKLAMYWYCKAAGRGQVTAQANLAAMYAAGADVPNGEELSYFCWLVFRDKSNNALAAEEREMLEKNLTPRQRATVLAVARNWKPK